MSARDEGRFEAAMYLQTLADHGAAFSTETAGKILSEALIELAFDTVRAIVSEVREQGVNAQLSPACEKLEGFAAVLAEVHWRLATERRADVVEAAQVIPLRTVPRAAP